jgi:hypothetical protein
MAVPVFFVGANRNPGPGALTFLVQQSEAENRDVFGIAKS